MHGSCRPPTTAQTQAGHGYELVEACSASSTDKLVVFVVGLGNHHTLFDFQRLRLAPAYRLLFIDLRGVNASESPPGVWHVRDMAADVLDVLDSVTPTWRRGMAVHLVGHSLGALICYEVLHLAPRGSITSLAMLSLGLGLNCCARPVLDLKMTGVLPGQFVLKKAIILP